jgi:hypothetical protein
MEQKYNRLVEEYRSFPGDAVMVLHLAATPDWARTIGAPVKSADVEHALAQLDAWHGRMKAVIDEQTEAELHWHPAIGLLPPKVDTNRTYLLFHLAEQDVGQANRRIDRAGTMGPATYRHIVPCREDHRHE